MALQCLEGNSDLSPAKSAGSGFKKGWAGEVGRLKASEHGMQTLNATWNINFGTKFFGTSVRRRQEGDAMLADQSDPRSVKYE